MTIAFLPRRIHAIGRQVCTRSIVRGAVARLPTLKSASPSVNPGRWATLPGEYASAWMCPLDEQLPAIAVPGTTAPIACGGSESVVLHLAGMWSGHILFEGSADGVVWRRVTLVRLTDDVIEDETVCPGLWRVLPGQHITLFRLHVMQISHGTILASVAAAPAMSQVIPRSLDSAA